MERALYGPAGFFTAGPGPAAHFRTSSHAAGPFVTAVTTLLTRVDDALGNPAVVDLVDVGAGRGELLLAVRAAAPPALRTRLRLTAVELAPRPADLPSEVAWTTSLPSSVTGLLTAVEWLDNVPLDVVRDGRYVLVNDSLGDPVSAADADWLARWWPSGGLVAEVGLPRDLAWSSAVSRVQAGLALAVDYGHVAGERPALGTLTGYRAGRQVPPVADGTCDITAHVAIDSVAAAGRDRAGREPNWPLFRSTSSQPHAEPNAEAVSSGGERAEPVLMRQAEALRALGADGRRPPIALASTDPAGYVRALAAASLATELTDPAGLGAHYWLLQGVDVNPTALLP
jgi:SAM-dependent MidA family methyltransferase